MDCKDSSSEHSKDKCVVLKNPHIALMEDDVLYHLALSTGTHDLQEMFSDVRFVCMGGSSKRMETFAKYMQSELNIRLPTGAALYDISQFSYRYSMFKVGPVLSVSHGMGGSSLSILLHEIIKLIYHAKCKDVTFVRLGTCGGIGIPPGSLVVTNEAVDTLMRPSLELHILGKIERRPALMDKELATQLKKLADNEFSEFATFMGKTMYTYDFYESQGRLDGAFCSYTERDKIDFLNQIHRDGVINMEMEAVTFAAMCHQAGIKGAIVCVTLLDRLQGDQVNTPKSVLQMWETRPQQLIAKFIKMQLNIP